MKTGDFQHGEGAGRSRAGALLGPAMLLFTLLGWSSVPLFVTHFSHAMNVWTQNGWRYLVGALVWTPVLVWARVRGKTPRGLWRASVMPAVFNALGQAAFTWSFYSIETSTAAFGLRTQIVFVSVGAYVLFPSERALLRRPGAWVGIGLVVAGVLGTMLLRDTSHDATTSVGGATAAWGMVMAVSAGLLFACYALAVRRNMQGFHPVTAFAAISQITAGISVALMLGLSRGQQTGALDGGWEVWALSAGQGVMLVVSAVIGITLGHAAYFVSIARLGVATTSGVLQLQPFCVAVAQFAVFGVLMTAGQWVSGVVAVIGALLLLYVQWRLTRAAGAPVGSDAGARLMPVAGVESEGIETAEMEAVPVESDGER